MEKIETLSVEANEDLGSGIAARDVHTSLGLGLPAEAECSIAMCSFDDMAQERQWDTA
jgi:hypothetical protein